MIGDEKMLELKDYGIIPIEDMKDIVNVIFVIIDDLYNAVTSTSVKYRLHKEKAILSDSEIITISLMGEIII